ncbi:hypothetical protein J6590_011684 [Homalodisca vitripennis]|nr:hypothetical protein J6590_011684 [Homalodisca vitripennis]
MKEPWRTLQFEQSHIRLMSKKRSSRNKLPHAPLPCQPLFVSIYEWNNPGFASLSLNPTWRKEKGRGTGMGPFVIIGSCEMNLLKPYCDSNNLDLTQPGTLAKDYRRKLSETQEERAIVRNEDVAVEGSTGLFHSMLVLREVSLYYTDWCVPRYF